MSGSELDILKRRLKREIAARKEAERILEEKALELYFKNKELSDINRNLEKEIRRRTYELRSSEEKYRGILENMELGLLEVNVNGLITKAYDSFCEMVGYTAEELNGKDPVKLFVRRGKEFIVEEQQKKRNSGQSGVYEIEMRRKDGNYIWVIISGAPFYDLQGNLIGTIGIHLDITSQKRLERNLIKSKEKAEKAEEREKMFLAQMSHELRTPLNGVLGLANILSSSSLDKEQRSLVVDLTEAASLLSYLIDNILDFTRIRTGEIDISPDRINVQSEMERIIRSVQKRDALTKNQILLESHLGNNEFANLNQLVFNQICINLLGNADKFTDQGTITIRLKNLKSGNGDELLSIQFEDTGCGIPQDEIPLIFESFKQVRDSINTNKGSGLGLAIVKQLVDLLDGSIEVESQVGKGSIFSVLLPVRCFEFIEEKDESSESKLKPNYFQIKVLIAEDNLYNQRYIAKLMERWGIEATIVDDGKKCIEELKKKRFDLCLIDINMPYFTGYEVFDVIKSDAASINYKTPFIALTAAALNKEKEKALSLGFTSFITKPFQPSQLEEVFNNYSHQNNEVKPIDDNPFNRIALPEKTESTALFEYYADDIEYAKHMLEQYGPFIKEEIVCFEKLILNPDKTAIKALFHKLQPSMLLIGRADLHHDFSVAKTKLRKGIVPPVEDLQALHNELKQSQLDVKNLLKSLNKHASNNN